MTGDVHDNLSRYIRHCYAEFWQNTVQMDWFKVYVYQCPDTENLRDLDFAGDEPELASHITKMTGIDIQPQDLLVGIGDTMMSVPGASDPDLWAAIDIGQIVCRRHYAEDPSWECRVSLLAGAAIAAFVANEPLSGAVFMRQPGDARGSRVVPKIHRLVDYLVWIAAGEKHRGPGQIERGELLGQFRCENELFVAMIRRAADAALALRSTWSSGPLTTATIAERGHLLMTEVLQNLLPVPVRAPIAFATPASSSPPHMQI